MRSIGCLFWKQYKNQQVDIIYQKANPKMVYIIKELKLHLGILFFIHFILALLGISLIAYSFILMFS